MNSEPTDLHFRDLLRAAFQERREKNERYSLRAFARDIGLSFARTSEILSRDDVGISRLSAMKVATALKWPQAKTNFFLDLVARDHGRSKSERESAKLKIEKMASARQFEHVETRGVDLLAKWYYIPILEVLSLHDGRDDDALIAEALNLSRADVRGAIEHLLAAGFLVRSARRVRKSKRLMRVESPSPSSQIREFHRQILRKALEAIEAQSMNERKLNSSLFTIRKADLEAAWRDVDAFEREFIAKYAAPTSENPDAVYVLSHQLFKLAER